MSDDNVPKLRLKPKLGADTAAASPAPTEVNPAAASAPAGEASVTDSPAPKLVRLKPKLAAAPVQETAPAVAPEPMPEAAASVAESARSKPRLSNPPMEVAPAPPPSGEPAPEAAKPVVRLGLKPKAALEAPPPVGAPATTSAPSQPVAETDRGENGEPGEITAMRKVSSMPFPPPPGAGNFPPPPGLRKAMQEAGESAGKASGAKGKGSKKKLFMLAGAGVALLIVLGGGFVAYQKFTEEPMPAPRPKVTAAPVQAETPPPAVAEPAVETPAATATVAAAPAATEAAPVEVAATEPTQPEEMKPVVPPPPPPASVAFRGWAENLKISGVRGGSSPRIFVGGTSYQRGDLVNPQMGISFEDYDDATRTIVFVDRSGARVERRN